MLAYLSKIANAEHYKNVRLTRHSFPRGYELQMPQENEEKVLGENSKNWQFYESQGHQPKNVTPQCYKNKNQHEAASICLKIFLCVFNLPFNA